MTRLPPITTVRPAIVGLLLAACLASLSTGCTRAYYRRQADAQVATLVQEKANHPHWPLEGYTIQIDPSSRMFDPFSPDRAPMPPDDPTSHQLMHRIDGYRGFPRWHKSGDTPHVENPEWMAYLPLNEDGELELDAEKAVLVARLHSLGYQQNLEQLYLSALDVSFERFRFDAQFFASYNADYLVDGPLRNFSNGSARAVAAQNNLGRPASTLVATTNAPTRPLGLNDAIASRGVRMQKLGTTGTEMIVGLANSIVWNFNGRDSNFTNTILDFTLFQPLLRRGGRDRVLERLTISERNLLGNVRQMEHYRRGFYLEVVTGRNAGQGPSRRGGVFGGSGLEGFSGVGGGGFGQVGTATGGFGGGGQGGAIATTAGAAQAGGLMGLLQRQQDIRNQEANIAALRSSLAQFIELQEANRIDYLQVEQARQALYNAQSRLRNTENDYANTLDAYKIQLGLPPQLEVKISDDMLEQFNLIDEHMVLPQNRLTDLRNRVGNTIREMLPAADADPADDPGVAWSPALAGRLRDLKRQIVEAQETRRQVKANNVARAKADIEKLIRSLPKRREDVERLQARLKREGDVGMADAVGDPNRLEKNRARLRNKLENLEQPVPDDLSLPGLDKLLEALPVKLTLDLSGVEQQLQESDTALQALDASIDELLAGGDALDPKDLLKELRIKVFAPVPNELTKLAANVLELSLLQARARADSVTLTSVDMPSDTAFEIARNYRRDWMNARAALVDSWRLIEFNADDLEASLDVVIAGDVANVGNNPVAFDSAAGRIRTSLLFDAPITRVSERNVYRQSLIEYQQARRSFYVVGDQISRGLRNSLRTIELNKLNFELRRSAMHVAIEQVDLARERLTEPPGPAEVGGAQLGATTARDLVSALTDLQNAQNDFLSVWVNYEVLRRTLDQDLGTMRLDERGLWVDPGAIGLRHGYPDLSDCEHCAPELFIPEDDEVSSLPAERLPAPRPNITPPAGPRPEPLPLPEPEQGAARSGRPTPAKTPRPEEANHRPDQLEAPRVLRVREPKVASLIEKQPSEEPARPDSRLIKSRRPTRSEPASARISDE